MSTTKKAINGFIGCVVVSAASFSAAVNAQVESPFALVDLSHEYMVAEAGAATDAKPAADAKAGEGKCGGKMKGMMDTDKDGKVSKDEFIKHHEHMFEMMDKDKNGVLDDSEMSHAGDMKKDMMGGGMGGGMSGGMKHGSGQPAGQ